MIRIAEILKNAVAKSKPSAGDPRPQENKAVLLTDDGLLAIYDEMLRTLKFIIAGREFNLELDEKGKELFAAAGKLADQQILRNPDLIIAANRLEAEEAYIHALKMAINSIKIGWDANYGRDRLKELVVAALVRGIETSEETNFQLLTEVLGRQANLETGDYQSIINLAEIYEHEGR